MTHQAVFQNILFLNNSFFKFENGGYLLIGFSVR